MVLSNPWQNCARFHQFQVDLSTGVLQRSGVRVPVQAQPLQVLRLLLQADGRVVTREELRKVLWPEDTFVDFELGVNTAVKKLRQALADPADRPKFIETLPKIGYRFLVPVEWVTENGQNRLTPKVQDSAPSAGIEITSGAENIGQVTDVVDLNWRSAVTKKWIWLAAGAAGFVLLSMAVLLHVLQRNVDQSSIAVEVVPLISMPGFQSGPAVSPDGSYVAFTSGDEKNGGIYVALVGGEKPIKLTDSGLDVNPTWSPDGRQIAFSRFNEDQTEKSIYVVPALGGLERRLYTTSTVPWAECDKMDWSPDGKSLVLTEAIQNGERGRLSLLSLSELKVRPLTAPVNQEFDCAPALSSDGTTIAFVRGTMGAWLGDLFVLKLSGGDPIRLTSDNSGGEPAWTQDGKEIVYSSPSKGIRSLWRIPATGGQARPVAFAGDEASEPSISRKGNQLAYRVSKQQDAIWQLILKDGPHVSVPPMRILSANGFSLRPDFSPDGKRVVFESDRMGYSDIWVCDRDGSNCNQLTALRGQAGTARWSPDGRYIAFEAIVHAFYQVYVVEAAGGIPRVVSTFPDCNNGAPNWSRDGQYIYFYSAHESGPYQLWKVALKGGPPLRVTTQGGVYAVESADQRFLYYAKFEQDGIFKMPLGGGVETRVLNKPAAGEWSLWTLARGGIYFVNRNVPPNGRIEYFDFATGQSTPILSLEKPSPDYGGLTLSPDGKSLLFAQPELKESYVMLVKNFH